MNNNSKKIISLNLEKNSSSLSEDEKIKAIAKHFRSIMEILNLDLTDNSLRDSPNRVAKI